MYIYNVPFWLADSPKYHEVVVRSIDPIDLLKCSKKLPSDRLAGIQLLSLKDDHGVLWDIDETVPIELVITDIERDFPVLYKYRELTIRHPICVVIPASPGLSKAARVAGSLGFCSRFQVTQPSTDVVAEMGAVLEFYLHSPTATEPIEFFSGLLAAFLHDQSTTIWSIQNEDPQIQRFVTDSGELLLSGRLPELLLPEENESFLRDLRMDLLAEMGDCSACEFFAHCSGYFKVPERDYNCKAVKELLRVLKNVSVELWRDYDNYGDQEKMRGRQPA